MSSDRSWVWRDSDEKEKPISWWSCTYPGCPIWEIVVGKWQSNRNDDSHKVAHENWKFLGTTEEYNGNWKTETSTETHWKIQWKLKNWNQARDWRIQWELKNWPQWKLKNWKLKTTGKYAPALKKPIWKLKAPLWKPKITTIGNEEFVKNYTEPTRNAWFLWTVWGFLYDFSWNICYHSHWEWRY